MNELTANARHEAPQSDELEKETQSESQPEETNEEEKEEVADTEEGNEASEEAEEEPTPFHKHPRWIERQKELEELRSENTELKGKAEPQAKTTDSHEYEKLYGDDPKTKELYSKLTEKQEEALEAKIMAKLEAKQTAEKAETDRQEAWIQGQLSALTEAGANYDENKLLKLMGEFRPLDEKGYFNFEKGYELYQLKYPQVKAEKPNKAVAEKASGASNESSDSNIFLAAV